MTDEVSVALLEYLRKVELGLEPRRHAEQALVAVIRLVGAVLHSMTRRNVLRYGSLS